MKNKNLLIIGAIVIAAIFIFKKPKDKTKLTSDGNPILPNDNINPVLPSGDINLHPIDMIAKETTFTYPNGIYEGMRAQGFDTQYLIQDGKIVKDSPFTKGLQYLARKEDKELISIFSASYEGKPCSSNNTFDIGFFIENANDIVNEYLSKTK